MNEWRLERCESSRWQTANTKLYEPPEMADGCSALMRGRYSQDFHDANQC